MNKIAPIIAGIARGVGMAAQMGAKAIGAAAKAGAKAGKTAAKVGKEAVKTGVNAAQDAVEAGSDVVSHANQTIDQSQPGVTNSSPSLSADVKNQKQSQDGLDQLNKSLDDFLLNKGIIDNAAKRYNEMKDTYSKYNKTHNFPGKSFIESNPETPGARTLSGALQMGRGAIRLGRAGKKKLAGDKKTVGQPEKVQTKAQPQKPAEEPKKVNESAETSETVGTVPENLNTVTTPVNTNIKIGAGTDKIKAVKPKTMKTDPTGSTASFSFEANDSII